MFNLSDILKKNKEEKAKGARLVNDPGPKEIPPPKKEPVQEVNIASVVNKDVPEEKIEDSHILYKEVLAKVKQVYTAHLGQASVIDLDLDSLLERMIVILTSNRARKELLRQCLYDYPTPEDYLIYHVLNVSIISLDLGRGLGYELLQLIELGRAALLHDIGITGYMNIINLPKKLSAEEFKVVKEHPAIGSDTLINNYKDLGQKVFEAVRQEHERSDGSGYPLGLKGNEINEYAQILGVADVYEAMIHDRPYRKKIPLYRL